MHWSSLAIRLLLSTCLLILSGCSGDKAPSIRVQSLIDPNQQLQLDNPQKPTLVVFWATSCSSCIQEIPNLVALQKANGDKLNIVGIAMAFDDPAMLRHFVRQHQLPYLVTQDTDDRIAQGFGKIFVTPTNFLLSRDGQIVWKNVGDLDIANLQNRINELL